MQALVRFPKKEFILFITIVLCLPTFLLRAQTIPKQESNKIASFLFNSIDYHKPEIIWDMPAIVQRDLNHVLTLLEKNESEQAFRQLKEMERRGDQHWAIYYYQGVSCNLLNKFDSAQMYFSNSSLLNANVPEIHLEQGKSILYSNNRKKISAKKKIDEAKNEFKKAIYLNPNRVDAYLYLAGLELILDNLKNAEDYLRKVEENEKGNYQALFLNALIKLRSKKKDKEALELINQSIEKKTDFVPGLLARIYLNESSKLYNRVLADLSTLIRLSPNNLMLLYQRGKLNTDLKNYDLAYQDFKKILTNEQFYTLEESFEGDQSNLDRTIDWQECIEYQIRTISVLPQGQQENLQKVISLGIIGKEKEAIESLELHAYKETANQLIVQALLSEQLGEHNQAFELYDKCIYLDNSVYLAFKKRSIYLAELGNYELAFKDLEQLDKLKPYSHVTHKLRGSFYYSNKRYKESENSFSKFLQTDSLNLEVLLSRAVVREKLNKNDEAFKDLHFYISETRDYRYFLMYKNLAIVSGNQEKAIDFFLNAFEDETINDGHYLVFAASLYLNLEKPNKAKEILKPVFEHNFGEVWIFYFQTEYSLELPKRYSGDVHPSVLYKLISEEFIYVQAELYIHEKFYAKAIDLVNIVININPVALEARYIRTKANLKYKPKDAYNDLLFLKERKYKNSEELFKAWREK